MTEAVARETRKQPPPPLPVSGRQHFFKCRLVVVFFLPAQVLGSHRKLKLPVLILKGSHDHICKEGLFVDLATYLDKYRLVVIEPCSHRVHLDAMAEVNTEISQWLLCL